MKAKHQRLLWVMFSILVMAGAATMMLSAMRDTLIFFYTPSQLNEKRTHPEFDAKRPLRIGGLVKASSVHNLETGGIRFTITDLTQEIDVTYRGLLPSLFREGQGVVAQGTLNADGALDAQSILAKHDETYMPREVMEQLKASGKWKGGAP